MAAKYMNIGGINFHVNKPSAYIPDCKGQLEDCYKKPSIIKRQIMSDWWFWASQLPFSVKMWVASYNCNFFTIGGEFWDGDIHYAFYITHTRQEVWEVIE